MTLSQHWKLTSGQLSFSTVPQRCDNVAVPAGLWSQLCCSYDFYNLSRSLEQKSPSIYRLYSFSGPQLFLKIMVIMTVWLRWIANSSLNWFKNKHWEVFREKGILGILELQKHALNIWAKILSQICVIIICKNTCRGARRKLIHA